MKNFSSNFLHTKDNEQIFYSHNFKHANNELTPLIFNYGLVCSNHHFQYQIEHFDNLGHPIILHDFRGHYNSSGIENLEKICFSQIAEDISELLEKLEIPKAHFLGHSMGVNICLEMAHIFPEKVDKLILISGSAFPVQNIMFDSNITDFVIPLLKRGREMYPEQFDLFWKFAGWNPIVKKIILLGGFNSKEVTEEFVEIYLNKVSKLGAPLFFQLMQQMFKHDILAHLNSIYHPALIIGGDKDRVIPNWVQKTLCDKLENSQIYIVKDGSHVPQVDFPEFINQRIELFL